MSVLNKKLRRDLLNSTGVVLTVVMIITVGSATFVGFGSAQRALESGQKAYYEDYRFADFWIEVKKAPLTAVQRIAAMPEIGAVKGRVVFNVILDLPGVNEPLTGRLISAPTVGFAHTINGLCLVRGSGFSDDRDEEVILGEAFAHAHSLSPGDRIELILNRKRQTFVIAGTAISPEYVYMVQGEGDLLPDPEHFGILYIKEDYARDVLDFQDACNQIVGQVSPLHTGPIEPLLEKLDRLLDPYGVLATTPRQRQASHRFVSDEIAGLSVTAVLIPAIFLGVAALALNLMMNRVVQRQRSIIGTLKALGYSSRRIVWHYVFFGVTIGVIGGICGDLCGLALAGTMINIYTIFYQFPRFEFALHADLLLVGIVISVVFAVFGTLRGVRAVLALQPAEAMRARPPRRGGRVWLERFGLLWNRLDFRSQMALRSVFRNRGRTLTGILSSTLAASIVLLTLAMYASMLFLVDFQFDDVAHSDVDIGLRDEQNKAALLEAEQLPGVDYAEPVLGVTCDMSRGRYSRRLTITGLSERHRLTTPMLEDLTPIVIPPEGLVMSRKLAELFHAQPGDLLTVVPVRGTRRPVQVRLASTVDSFLGLDCYAHIDYLSRIVGESTALSAVQLAVNPEQQEQFYAAVKTLPNAQGLGIRANTIHNIEDTFVKTSLFSLGMMVVFSGVISLGSTLNSALIELQDRLREISTLRVMGYTPAQVAGIFLRQNLIIGTVGFVIAMPFGYAMTLLLARAYDTELYRLPVIFHPSMIVLTAAVFVVFTALAQWVVYRQICRLDWPEGIKIKE